MSAEKSHVAFVLVTAAVMLVPGPSVAYAAGRAYALGPRAGLCAVLGLEAGLGVRALISSPVPVAVVAATGLRRVFREGLLVDLVNPKTMLFVTALLPSFVDPERPVAPQVLGLGAVVVVLALVVDGSYAVGAALLARRTSGGTTPRVARVATGGAFLGLAALSLWG